MTNVKRYVFYSQMRRKLPMSTTIECLKYAYQSLV